MRARHAALASVVLAATCAACASQPAPTIRSTQSRTGPSIFDILNPPRRPRRSEPVVREAPTYPPFDLHGALDAAGVPARAPDDSESIRAARGDSPAPTPADRRSVRITSEPPRARVYLGVRSLGVTPISVRAPADDIWVLRVQRAGYHPGWVTIPSASSAVRVVLSPERAPPETDGRPRPPCYGQIVSPCPPDQERTPPWVW